MSFKSKTGRQFDADDKTGDTVLFIAVKNGLLKIVKRLVEMGENINSVDQDLNTPLHIAAAWGYLDIVLLLLMHGASPKAKNAKGWVILSTHHKMPLDYAYSVEIRQNMLGKTRF